MFSGYWVGSGYFVGSFGGVASFDVVAVAVNFGFAGAYSAYCFAAYSVAVVVEPSSSFAGLADDAFVVVVAAVEAGN